MGNFIDGGMVVPDYDYGMNQKSALAITFDREAYFQGDTIKGWIQLSLQQHFYLSDIIVSLKLEEGWVNRKNKDYYVAENNELIISSIRLNIRAQLKATSPTINLPQGVNCFTFSFPIPNVQPTFEMSTKDHKGYIRYCINVSTESKPVYSNQKFIVVQSRAKPLMQPLSASNETKLFHMVFMDKGSASLTASIQKNNITFGETIPITFSIDNSKGNIDVKYIKVRLMRTFAYSFKNKTREESVEYEAKSEYYYVDCKRNAKLTQTVQFVIRDANLSDFMCNVTYNPYPHSIHSERYLPTIATYFFSCLYSIRVSVYFTSYVTHDYRPRVSLNVNLVHDLFSFIQQDNIKYIPIGHCNQFQQGTQNVMIQQPNQMMSQVQQPNYSNQMMSQVQQPNYSNQLMSQVQQPNPNQMMSQGKQPNNSNQMMSQMQQPIHQILKASQGPQPNNPNQMMSQVQQPNSQNLKVPQEETAYQPQWFVQSQKPKPMEMQSRSSIPPQSNSKKYTNTGYDYTNETSYKPQGQGLDQSQLPKSMGMQGSSSIPPQANSKKYTNTGYDNSNENAYQPQEFTQSQKTLDRQGSSSIPPQENSKKYTNTGYDDSKETTYQPQKFDQSQLPKSMQGSSSISSQGNSKKYTNTGNDNTSENAYQPQEVDQSQLPQSMEVQGSSSISSKKYTNTGYNDNDETWNQPQEHSQSQLPKKPLDMPGSSSVPSQGNSKKYTNTGYNDSNETANQPQEFSQSKKPLDIHKSFSHVHQENSKMYTNTGYDNDCIEKPTPSPQPKYTTEVTDEDCPAASLIQPLNDKNQQNSYGNLNNNQDPIDNPEASNDKYKYK